MDYQKVKELIEHDIMTDQYIEYKIGMMTVEDGYLHRMRNKKNDDNEEDAYLKQLIEFKLEEINSLENQKEYKEQRNRDL